jgi:o-succinylbenzoate synthase
VALRLRRVEWASFALPFVVPFGTAHETSVVREGFFLRLSTSDGLTGLGEAAPLPAFGGGRLADALELLLALAPRLVGASLDDVDQLLAAFPCKLPGASAVACALDTAVCDLRGRADELPFAELLGGAATRPVRVNATIGAAGSVAAARSAAAAGFTCIKLKVGVASSIEAEVHQIEAVRTAIGDAVQLRLDANGAWSVDQAVAVIRAVEGLGIELVEQPVAADDLAGLARVRSRVATPIAADESVGGPEQARRVVEAGAADLLVVKPMVVGGPRRARTILELAREAGLSAYVTTTVDAGIATAAALHLATLLPDQGPACGLATSGLLEDDLTRPSVEVDQGWMRAPAGPGLGVQVDEVRLARYGSAWAPLGATG